MRRVSTLRLTIGVGGDADGIGGRTGPVAIERQHSNGVLCELIESIHLVGGTVHLHALEQHRLETCVISMRVGWGRRSRQVEWHSPVPCQRGSQSKVVCNPGWGHWGGWEAPSSPGPRWGTGPPAGLTPPCWEPGLETRTHS